MIENSCPEATNCELNGAAESASPSAWLLFPSSCVDGGFVLLVSLVSLVSLVALAVLLVLLDEVTGWKLRLLRVPETRINDRVVFDVSDWNWVTFSARKSSPSVSSRLSVADVRLVFNTASKFATPGHPLSMMKYSRAPLVPAFTNTEFANSTGFTLLQMLRIVGRFDLAALGWNSPALIHLLVEAKKRAFLDREAHGGDPRGGAIPLDRLLSAEHAAAHAAAIDPRRAAHLPVRPEAGGGGDTTYFCVVDAAGNCVSAIQSLNSAFGSGVIAEGTGVLLNNRMAYWHLEPGHANALRPGLRVRHTMNAPLLLKDGRPWCVLGTPGADHQVQVNLQAIVAMVDFGLDPQQALEAPRWTSSQPGQEANYPHGGAELLTLEAGFGAGTAAALEELGHRVRLVGDLEGPCSLEAIRLLGNGVRMAASDPRRDGWAGAH